MENFDRQQALKLLKKAKKRDNERIMKKTHKLVRTQHGRKLIKIN